MRIAGFIFSDGAERVRTRAIVSWAGFAADNAIVEVFELDRCKGTGKFGFVPGFHPGSRSRKHP